MPSNVATRIELSDDERAQLEAWARRRTTEPVKPDETVSSGN